MRKFHELRHDQQFWALNISSGPPTIQSVLIMVSSADPHDCWAHRIGHGGVLLEHISNQGQSLKQTHLNKLDFSGFSGTKGG